MSANVPEKTRLRQITGLGEAKYGYVIRRFDVDSHSRTMHQLDAVSSSCIAEERNMVGLALAMGPAGTTTNSAHKPTQHPGQANERVALDEHGELWFPASDAWRVRGMGYEKRGTGIYVDHIAERHKRGLSSIEGLTPTGELPPHSTMLSEAGTGSTTAAATCPATLVRPSSQGTARQVPGKLHACTAAGPHGSTRQAGQQQAGTAGIPSIDASAGQHNASATTAAGNPPGDIARKITGWTPLPGALPGAPPRQRRGPLPHLQHSAPSPSKPF